MDRLPGYDDWKTDPEHGLTLRDLARREDRFTEATERADRCEAIRQRIREKLAPAIAAGLIEDFRQLEAEHGCLPGYAYEFKGKTCRMRIGCVEDLNLELLHAASIEDDACRQEDFEDFMECSE